MERTCQFSYPRNSANASPPGTFTVYLSWADRALPPNALTSAVTIAIVPKPLLFITGSSFVKASSSAHRFLHERADPCLGGGGQLLHGGSYLVRESLDRLAGHGSALGGLLCIRLWAHRASLKDLNGARLAQLIVQR